MSSEDSATVVRRIVFPPLGWAALGVLAFSFTFPATVLAERGFDPDLVGAGRSVVAAAIAAVCLRAVRAPLPRRSDLPGLIAVAVGCGIGFGLLSALALHHTTSTHAAVIVGLLPAATAIVAVLRTAERPRWPFWAASVTGTGAIVTYALSRGGGALRSADLLLLAALAVGAVGYAEGGRIARTMPGWHVIAWGVLLALPVSLPVTAIALVRASADPTPAAIAGFVYVGVFSMFLGFLAWYRGLAEAGIARASQLQLVQPMLTIAWSVPLLGESAGPAALLTGAIVAVCVLVTQRSRAREGSTAAIVVERFAARTADAPVITPVCDHPAIAKPPTLSDIKKRLAVLHDLRAADGEHPSGGPTPDPLDAMRESMAILSDPQMMRRVRAGRQAVAAGDLVALEEPAGPAPPEAGSSPTAARWRVVLTGPVARELAQMDVPAATAVRERLVALATAPAEQGRALGMGLVGVLCARGASHRVLYALHQGQRLVTVLSVDDGSAAGVDAS